MTSEMPVPPERTLNYAFLLGGIVAFVFGIILLIRQDEALGMLMVILGLWWLIQGLFLLFAVFLDPTDVGWKLAIGVLGVVAGFLVLTNPAEASGFISGAVGVLVGLIGLAVGVSSILGSFRGGGFGALIFGLVSGLIGALILLNPGWSARWIINVIALVLVVDGIAGIYLAFRYK